MTVFRNTCFYCIIYYCPLNTMLSHIVSWETNYPLFIILIFLNFIWAALIRHGFRTTSMIHLSQFPNKTCAIKLPNDFILTSFANLLAFPIKCSVMNSVRMLKQATFYKSREVPGVYLVLYHFCTVPDLWVNCLTFQVCKLLLPQVICVRLLRRFDLPLMRLGEFVLQKKIADNLTDEMFAKDMWFV